MLESLSVSRNETTRSLGMTMFVLVIPREKRERIKGQKGTITENEFREIEK